jgi:PAS domain S-box-containing protein
MTTKFDLDRFSKTLVLDAGDAIIYADPEGLIRFWNGAAERIFGFGESEVLGRSLDVIIPENLRGRHWHGYEETMRTGKSRYAAGDLLAVPALRKDGTRISVEFTAKTAASLGSPRFCATSPLGSRKSRPCAKRSRLSPPVDRHHLGERGRLWWKSFEERHGECVGVGVLEGSVMPALESDR